MDDLPEWTDDADEELEWQHGGYSIRIPPARFGDQLVIHDLDVLDEDGILWFGYLATLDMITERLDYYRKSGEGADGRYFVASGMIVVRDMEHETLRIVVNDLIDEHQIEKVLLRAGRPSPIL